MRFIGIDPSTKTGFVALDEQGSVLRAKELTGVGKEDPKRIITLVREIMDHIQPEDVIVIEGFSHGSKGAYVGQQYYIGWAIRANIFARGMKYYEVSPMSLKKFAGATGNKGPDGKAIKADKIEVAKQVLKRWNFESGSDNVTDAYVLAQIALALKSNIAIQITKAQLEVLDNIRNPPDKKKRKRVAQ